MKKICLLRHAKSSWKDRHLNDRERPLKKRGFRDCQLIGQLLQKSEPLFEQVFCSDAKRARQTATEVIAAMQYDIEINVEESLYEFDARRVLRWIRGLDDSLDSVLVVGHNPAFTDLCNDLSGTDLENLPTCGFAVIECDVTQWRRVTDDCGKNVSLITPRMLRDEKILPEHHWYR